ncbi:MAG: hypothetical protein ACK55Z_05970, partial [bacterium]
MQVTGRVVRHGPDEVQEMVEELIETLELVAEEAARALLIKAPVEIAATQTSFDHGVPASTLLAVVAAAAAATQTSFVEGEERGVHELAATATQTSHAVGRAGLCMQLEELVCATHAAAPGEAEAGTDVSAANDAQPSVLEKGERMQDSERVYAAVSAPTQHPQDAASATQLDQQQTRRAQQAQQFCQFQQTLEEE